MIRRDLSSPEANHAPTSATGAAPEHGRKLISRRPASSGVLALMILLVFEIAFSSLRAQDTPSDNPTGPDGDYNGEVTTGCGYDPYTANAKRTVTDLVVPGSSGAYPLAFSRTFNSQTDSTRDLGDEVFGECTQWRHSYQWTLGAADYSSGGTIVCAYNILYPDGSSITFRPRDDDPNYPAANYPGGRSSTPHAESYWRGPAGTTDRLEVRSTSSLWLHTSDGGLVKFEGQYGITHPTTIVDPYGAVTILQYGYVAKGQQLVVLKTVTEPGGRYLTFAYAKWTRTPMDPNGVMLPSGYELVSVQATPNRGGNDQMVTFVYTNPGASNNEVAPFHVFSGVKYPSEGSNVNAQYSYDYNSEVPLMTSAVDPHFAGAMSQIYYGGADNYGSLAVEANYNTQAAVSHLSQSGSGGVLTSTETRGDVDKNGAAITRQLIYGQGSTVAYPPTGNVSGTGAEPSQLTEVVDFQGVPSYLQYFDNSQRDGNGQGYLASSADNCGYKTQYTREPILGQATSVTISGANLATSTVSQSQWTNSDDDTTNGLYPYFLYSRTNEQGQTTYYHHTPFDGNDSSQTGLVRWIAYPDGGREYFWYQAFNYNGSTFYKLAIHQNQLGAQVYYTYDQAGHGGSGYRGLLTSVTRYYADGFGNVPGETTSIYYDPIDRVSQRVDPRGVTDSYTYNGRHQVLTDLHGDGNGNGGDGSCLYYGYNTFGRMTDVFDELLNHTQMFYDEYGRITSVVKPVNSNTTRTTYTTYDGRDPNNRLIAPALSHTDARFSYQVLPSGRGVQHIYSPNGWLTDEYGGHTIGNPATDGNLSFDAAVHTKANLGYDAMGRLSSSTDAQGQVWYFGMDGRSRPTYSQDPLGHTVTTTYYPPGNGASTGLKYQVTAPGNDSASQVTTTYTAYDTMGRLTGWSDPSASYASSYNALGDLISQSDGMSTSQHPATGYGFDGLGRKTQITYADGSTEQWHYDASGNVSTYKNRAGNTQTFGAYDLRNRPTGWAWSDNSITPASAIGFDTVGHCTYMNNTSCTLSMGYDGSGVQTSETVTFPGSSTSKTVTYTPDVDGNPTQITYPSGDVAYTPTDFLGRVQNVEFAYANNTAGIYDMATYSYAGTQLTERATGYNVATSYGYQANGRVEVVVHNFINGTNNNAGISQQTYGYNPNGQMSWFLRSGVANNTNAFNDGSGDDYSYRSDGSLRGIYYHGYGVNSTTDFAHDVPAKFPPTNAQRADYYDYDGAGNRITDYEAGVDLTPTFGSGNQQTNLVYDANGNTTQATYNNVTYTYRYNAYNQLYTATGGGNSATFVYDPKGRLCERIINGVGTLLYYAGDKLIEEDNTSYNKLRFYLYGAGGERVFRLDTDVYCYLYDGRGWLSHITDLSNTSIEQYQYDAFGRPHIYNGTGSQSRGQVSAIAENRFLWNQDYEWYPEIGLYRCGARFYSPALGRFLQPDPIGQSGGLNIYAYCQSDPINGSDPSGLDESSDNLQDHVHSPGLSTPTGSNIPGNATAASFLSIIMGSGSTGGRDGNLYVATGGGYWYFPPGTPPGTPASTIDHVYVGAYPGVFMPSYFTTAGFSALLGAPIRFSINGLQASPRSIWIVLNQLPLDSTYKRPEVPKGHHHPANPDGRYFTHFYRGPSGYGWDPDTLGNDPTNKGLGKFDNPLNEFSLAVSDDLVAAGHLTKLGPVYANGTYIGNYDDRAPEGGTIDTWDPGNEAGREWGAMYWGGTISNHP